MAWQENVGLVVMLAQTTEEGRVKCDQYWPKGVDEILEDDEFELKNEHIDEGSEGIVVSTLSLHSKVVSGSVILD